MPIKEKDYWPYFKKVLDDRIELLLEPLDVIALFHPARLSNTVAGSSRTTCVHVVFKCLPLYRMKGGELKPSRIAASTDSDVLVV